MASRLGFFLTGPYLPYLRTGFFFGGKSILVFKGTASPSGGELTGLFNHWAVPCLQNNNTSIPQQPPSVVNTYYDRPNKVEGLRATLLVSPRPFITMLELEMVWTLLPGKQPIPEYMGVTNYGIGFLVSLLKRIGRYTEIQ